MGSVDGELIMGTQSRARVIAADNSKFHPAERE